MPYQSQPISRRSFLAGAAGGVALSLLPVTARPAAAQSAPAPDLACWGDSLTYGVGGNGVTYPGLIAANLGISVYNGGVIGERSSGIATRQGGRRPAVTVPAPFGAPLPPGTFRVNLDQALPYYERTMVIQEEGTLPGTLSGVPGVLNKQGDYRNEMSPYYFTRDSGTNRPGPGPFIADTGPKYAGADHIIWAGHNDLRSIDAPNLPPYMRTALQTGVKNNIEKMTDYAADRGSRYMVLSLINGKGAGNGSGTTGEPTEYYKSVVLELNPALAAALGPAHYIDIRTWLVRDAMAYGGLTPTRQDRLDMEEDIPPTSLTLFGIDPHLNPTGYTLVARYISERLVALGWYSRSSG